MRRTGPRSWVAIVALVACVAIVVAVSSLPVTSVGALPRERSGIKGLACVPTVDGPVPVTESPPAFMAVLQANLPSGWVDEEFFISCSSPEITYKTAVFVRRPADPSRASGVVAVDPLHSSGIWGLQTLLQPYFVAQDDAHVGVAASHDVVERLLKGANPTRYASLDVPDTPDAPNEILAGVGALLHQHRDSLLAGIRVKSAILGGWSQTAVVTRTFISSPQAKGTVDGRRVFDGFFPGQAAVGSSGGAQAGRIPDIGVPVVELQGERELLVTISVYGTLGYRRPDSRTYRLYEVAAMSHINNEPDNPVSGFAGSLDCDWPAGATSSAFRQTDIWAIGFDNLVRWISKRATPPRAARIELEADGRTVKRDGNGNALGGVRSVFVDVPTASIMPTSLAPDGVLRNPCAYAGYQLDFSPERLQQLYRTHAGYVQQVTADTDKLVRKRLLLPESARELVAAAQNSNILR
jgi:Alpha/beta hydrolase domain